MASTYVNNLRLNEMGTGDASGTWGTTTNTNLELIGEALGFGTEAITTNADTHTTTVADGASDAGRAMYLKYTGTLDSACTITIAPNTMKRMQFIENATSGSQNIIISQGSGANVTIPAGDVKAVYLDGAGSGAAVTDAFASLNVVDLKVEDDLTVTDDLIVNGDIDLEGSIDVNGTTNLDVVDIDGAVDMASTLQVDGSITSSDGMTITTADNSDTLSLISTDADANSGPHFRLYRNSSSPADNDFLANFNFVGRNDNSQDVQYAEQEVYILDASDGSEDGLINFNVTTAGSNLSYMQLRAGSGIVLNEDSNDIDFRVESNGNANMLFVDGGNDKVGIGTSTPDSLLDIEGVHSQLRLTDSDDSKFVLFSYSSGKLIVRNNSTDTTDNIYALQEDGNFGIGTHIPSEKLHIATSSGDCTVLIEAEENSSSREPHLQLKGTNTSSNPIIEFGDSAGFPGTIEYENSDNSMRFGTNSGERIRILSGGGITFGGDTATANALDDYEEGNATLVIATSDTQFSVGTVSDSSTYTRIGNQVTLFISIAISSPSGGSGALRLTGLPFANNGPQVTTSVCSMGRMANSQTQKPFGLLPNGSDVITFFFNADGAVASSYSATNLNGQVTPFMNATITYTT